MIKTIIPVKFRVADACSIPPLLAPMWRAAQEGCSLEPSMRGLVHSFGFESFMYGMSTAPHPLRDSRSYVWTTLPQEWVTIYDERSYIEVDPRVTQTWQRVTPFLWDRNICQGDARVSAFLDQASQYGVGSGVVIPLRDPLHAMVIVALNSPEREISDERHDEIAGTLGRIVLFASHFHELFMSSCVDAGLPPRQEGLPLSAREVQCLGLAARGLTSYDIGQKLGLVERTINFHFCNIISKLAAANRGEAIAIAVRRGIVAA